MELSAEEYMSLTSGDDCPLHSHSFDRSVTHDSVLQYQDSEGSRVVYTSYSPLYADDYLFVDTTAGAVTLSLPIARGGKTYTVVKLTGANNVVVLPNGTDTINGAASKSVTTAYTPLKIKAVKGLGWVQI